ncbi:hypothetical protein NVIRSERR_04392 [Serratia marcescens]|nr:hypothetical protein NVIRSERR_04392 [Serratia marcescens]
MKMLDSVSPVSAEYSMNSEVATAPLRRLTMPEITNTSASWAMIRPKKVIWLEKMKLRIAGVLAAYQETNAVSSRPQVIQP